MVEPAGIEDAARVEPLLALVNPDRLVTASTIEHVMRALSADTRWAAWKVVADGAIVGWSLAALEVESTEPGRASVGVAVHPDHRRRGLGTALWRTAERHLTDVGAHRVRGDSLDLPASCAFAHACGFREEQRQLVVALDPRTLPPLPSLPQGAEIRPFRDFEDDPTPIFTLDAEASADIPGEALDALEYEQWRRFYWSHPTVSHDVSAALVVDGEVVAASFVRYVPGGDRAGNDLTATVRRHRGKGYARLVKHAALLRLAELGVTRVVTENAESNEAMRAVNARLGYAPLLTRIAWERPPA